MCFTKDLAEMHGVVYLLKPGDYQAGSDSDSLALKNFRHASLIFQFATLTGDAVLKIYSGATAGTKTTSEIFKYRLADAAQAAATADTFGDRTTLASAANGLTLTAATYANKILICEISADELTADQPWITAELSAAADALNLSLLAILNGSRYPANDQPTAIS